MKNTPPASDESIIDSDDTLDYGSTDTDDCNGDADVDTDDDDDEVQILDAGFKIAHTEFLNVPHELDYDVLLSVRKKNKVKLEMLYLNTDSYDLAISGATETDVKNAKMQLVANKVYE